MSSIKNKFILSTVLIFSIFALITAYFIQYILGHEPCNLCLIERIPYFTAVALISLVFFLNKYEKLISLIVGLFFIHRVITAVPTFSGSAMGDLNLFSIVVVFLLTSFMFDGKVEKKFKAISARMMDLWDGKSSDDKDKKKQVPKGGSVVSVSQPISRGGMPTHAPSRADYLNSPNTQTSSTQMMPAQQQPQSSLPTQEVSKQEQYSNLPLEPAAYNSGGGGFATF